MKFRSFLVPALFLSSFALAPQAAHADVITYFDFNDGDFISDDASQSSTIDYGNFVDGDDVSAGGSQGTTLSDPQINVADGGALTLFNLNYADQTPNQGKYITFNVNTSNYAGLKLSFATQQLDGSAGDGFDLNTIQYSTDGTNFVNFQTYSPAQTYGLVDVDFSGVTALNGNANAAFRFLFDGGSTTSDNSGNSIDNIVLSGTAVATPEPSTWALMLLGMVATLMMMRRKRDEEARVQVPANSDF